MKKIAFGTMLRLVISLLNSEPAHCAVTLLDKDEWKFQVGGFVETDMINDTTRSFTEVVGNGAVARSNTFAGDNGRTQFSVRNSRFAFTVLAPVQNGWK